MDRAPVLPKDARQPREHQSRRPGHRGDGSDPEGADTGRDSTQSNGVAGPTEHREYGEKVTGQRAGLKSHSPGGDHHHYSSSSDRDSPPHPAGDPLETATPNPNGHHVWKC